MANAVTGRDTVEAMFSSLSKEVYRNLEAKQADILRLNDLLSKADESRQQWAGERAKLETNADRLSHLLAKAEDSRREVDEARRDAKSQRDWFKSELERVRVESESAKKEHGALMDEMRRTRSELDEARKERDQAVKLLHQAQLETGDWKSEFEKCESSMNHLRRETSQWKDQARHWQDLFLKAEEERRILATKMEELRERGFVAQKVKSEELPVAPLTPASSSRNADQDDSTNSLSSSESPAQIQRRSQKANANAGNSSTANAQRRAGTNTVNVFKVSKTPKTSQPSTLARTLDAPRAIDSATKSKKAPRARPTHSINLDAEEDAEEESLQDIVSSPSPLVYPEPEPRLHSAVASSSKAVLERSTTRTRVLRRVSDHQFIIKREDDHLDGYDGNQRPEDGEDDEDDELDEEEEEQGLSGPLNFVYNASGGRAIDKPKYRTQNAWDLFGDEEEEEEEEEVPRAGPSSVSTGRKGRTGTRGGGRKASRSRSRLPRKASDSRPNYAEEDLDNEEGYGEEGVKVEYRQPHRARSESTSSSVDELMITADGPSATGAVGGPYTPRNTSSKKRPPTPSMASSSEAGKKKRKR
ncbi:hypothetical protein GYMLUDRAFT_86936 [Collybiopsis luxurians FD-317 M1]|uniref:Uncharacterized protein n=1 Tax=Collybiopsis luxurians FD-317 M1 TaxID=944289 RepID=A0A0D0BQ21_9AGAR|nr:hypothetical protein GYMLUDRAFT_86936 [Collybiopsis luxurians FD-317 M1]